MRTLALAAGFLKDHARTTAVLIETLILIMFFSFFFQPSLRDSGYSWPEFTLNLGALSIVASAVSTFIIAWRNADGKMTILILKAGKAAYFLGVLLASLVLAAIEVAAAAGAYLAMRSLIGMPLGGAPQTYPFLLATLANMLVVSVCFLLFSSLTGRPREPAFATILVILGLASSQMETMGAVWGKLAILLPPLPLNLQAASSGASGALAARSLVYFAVVMSLGMARFFRREC